MKLHDVIGGTPEWRALRCGIPTASEFNRIMNSQPKWRVLHGGVLVSSHNSAETAEKGRAKEQKKSTSGSPLTVVKEFPLSESAVAYRYELLAERIMGHEADSYESQWMSRGKDLEDEAVRYYELMTDSTTDPGGFVTLDDGTVGCSPDRLVYETGKFKKMWPSDLAEPLQHDIGIQYDAPVGGLEIKCPSPGVHLQYLMSGDHAEKTYKHQVQGCMWVCGLQWWDILSYHPELPPALVRVERDEDWIEAFEPLMCKFLEALEDDTGTIIRNHPATAEILEAWRARFK